MKNINIKTIFCVFFLMLLCYSGRPSFAAGDYIQFYAGREYCQINIDGVSIKKNLHAAPNFTQGRLFISMPALAASLNIPAIWDANKHSALFEKNGRMYLLTVGDKNMYVNGVPVPLIYPPYSELIFTRDKNMISGTKYYDVDYPYKEYGNIMLPFFDIADSAGIIYSWNEADKTLLIPLNQPEIIPEKNDLQLAGKDIVNPQRIDFPEGHYIGEVSNGRANGFGLRNFNDFQNHGIYVGMWENGYRQGPGIFYFKSGELYIGDWVQGKITGDGIMHYNNKDDYYGYFKDGVRSGLHGVMIYSNGDMYSGEWENNYFNGPGTYYKFAGEETFGYWLNGIIKEISYSKITQPDSDNANVTVNVINITDDDYDMYKSIVVGAIKSIYVNQLKLTALKDKDIKPADLDAIEVIEVETIALRNAYRLVHVNDTYSYSYNHLDRALTYLRDYAYFSKNDAELRSKKSAYTNRNAVLASFMPDMIQKELDLTVDALFTELDALE